ncbi:MAG: glycosyltransferase family 4 protein [Acidobacteriota bacterium]|nr:glycosyltransferase family 4 protein [Acidobacteriota bacterium]
MIAASGQIDLQVIYLHRTAPHRLWKRVPIAHKAEFLDETPRHFAKVYKTMLNADLAIFNYYAERSAIQFLNARAEDCKPWCYWGERPGFHKPTWMGRLLRRWKLARLHSTQAPIWGIGQFALDGYQSEFGQNREYYNLPYFSNLERFRTNGILRKTNGERVILFSGSLIHRKGVDLLARAFVRLAGEVPNVRLRLMGEGNLRNSLMKTLQPVKDRVEFLGFKDWSELPACYAAADVLCVPSRYDGWGLVVPEGLAAGLPVIGTDRMGAAIEFIQTGHNGWLTKAGSEDSLLAALREAVTLPSENIAERSLRAQESVSEHTLNHGAERLIRAAQGVVRNWEG